MATRVPRFVRATVSRYPFMERYELSLDRSRFWSSRERLVTSISIVPNGRFSIDANLGSIGVLVSGRPVYEAPIATLMHVYGSLGVAPIWTLINAASAMARLGVANSRTPEERLGFQRASVLLDDTSEKIKADLTIFPSTFRIGIEIGKDEAFEFVTYGYDLDSNDPEKTLAVVVSGIQAG